LQKRLDPCVQGLSVFVAERVPHPRLDMAAEGVYCNIFACLWQKCPFWDDFRREQGSGSPEKSAKVFKVQRAKGKKDFYHLDSDKDTESIAQMCDKK
jgi:hypothetical protein